MIIRKTTAADLPAVMEIYKQAREMMAESGNPNQWANGHPSQYIIESDIAKGISYVCDKEVAKPLFIGKSGFSFLEENKNRAEAVFCFDTAPDPTYEKIEGAWLNNETYGVVHRIARAKNAKGTGAFCLEWCFGQIPNIRIDTHKDNAPMIKLLNNLGYKYCGIIWLENGEERMAFQKTN